jgi:hypothetical protein
MGWSPLAEDWLEDGVCYYTRGNEQHLKMLLRAALITDPHYAEQPSIRVRARFRGCKPYLDLYNDDPREQRLKPLVALFLKEHEPAGLHVAYDDESTHKKVAHVVDVYEPNAPAREGIGAQYLLNRWLSARGIDPAPFGLGALDPDATCPFAPIDERSEAGDEAMSGLPLFDTTLAVLNQDLPVYIVAEHQGAHAVALTFSQVEELGLVDTLAAFEAPARNEDDSRPVWGARMSWTHAFLDVRSELFDALTAAVAARGARLVREQDDSLWRAEAMAKYSAEFVRDPLKHGDRVCLDRDGGNEITLQLRDGRLEPHGYRAYRLHGGLRRRIYARVGFSDWIKPKEAAPTESVLTIAGSEGPSDAMRSYLKTKRAQVVVNVPLGYNWAYALSGTWRTVKRIRKRFPSEVRYASCDTRKRAVATV